MAGYSVTFAVRVLGACIAVDGVVSLFNGNANYMHNANLPDLRRVVADESGYYS